MKHSFNFHIKRNRTASISEQYDVIVIQKYIVQPNVSKYSLFSEGTLFKIQASVNIGAKAGLTCQLLNDNVINI